MFQDTLMKFDPATGEQRPYPSHAKQWRLWHGHIVTAWLFNPWTGDRRSASDVGCDPLGHLILPPGEKKEAETQEITIRGNDVHLTNIKYGPHILSQAEVDAHRAALREEINRQRANPINPPAPFA